MHDDASLRVHSTGAGLSLVYPSLSFPLRHERRAERDKCRGSTVQHCDRWRSQTVVQESRGQTDELICEYIIKVLTNKNLTVIALPAGKQLSVYRTKANDSDSVNIEFQPDFSLR